VVVDEPEYRNRFRLNRSFPRPLLGLLVIFIPIVALAAVGPHQWFLNTPVLWLGALVLFSLLRGPMHGAPGFIKKLLKIGISTLIAFGLVILLMWEPLREAAKRAPPLVGGIWLFLVMSTGLVWQIAFWWILFAKPKQRQFAVPIGSPQVRQEVRPKPVQKMPWERFADVGGMDKAKDQIREVIQAHLQPEKYKKYRVVRNGILLHGPRGTGKTLLARATAGEFRLNFEYVSAPSLYRRWIGATGENIRARFAEAAQRRPVLLFIDEIDSLGAGRGAGGSNDPGGAGREFDNITMQLFTAIDEYRALEGFIIMAATNRLDAVDEALIREGRFDVKIRVDLPDEHTRLAIFGKQLAK